MRRVTWGIVAASGLVFLAACGGGNGTVYVGVGVAGPWGGYPYPYPGVPGGPIGYPPPYWYEDEDQDASDQDGAVEAAEDRDAWDQDDAVEVAEDRDAAALPGDARHP